jgi:hypothetical protein
MQRSVSRVLMLSLFGIALAGFTAREMVQASQLASESSAKALPVLDAIEQGDQASTVACAELNRLVMQADVAALGVKLAKQSQPAELPSAIVNLQGTANRLSRLNLNQSNLDDVRSRYSERLQTVLQLTNAQDSDRLTSAIVDLTQFSRDQILLNHCSSQKTDN